MSVNTEVENTQTEKISTKAGKWLGWIGIVVGIIGFFWMRIVLGAIAAVLGVIGVFSSEKTLNIIAIVAGAIAIVLGIVL